MNRSAISSFSFTDDPYYCGMRARVPNFVSSASNKKPPSKENQHQMTGGVKNRIKQSQQQNMHNSSSAPNLAQLPGAAPPFWWHSRLYPDSGELL